MPIELPENFDGLDVSGTIPSKTAIFHNSEYGGLLLTTDYGNENTRNWAIETRVGSHGSLNFRSGTSPGADPTDLDPKIAKTRMIIGHDGHVGIGTTWPRSPGIGASPVLNIHGPDPGIRFSSDEDEGGGENTILADDGDLRFCSGSAPDAEKMRLTSAGDLEVVGSINAKKVCIQNWELSVSDYVFDDDYDLMGLADLERYVKDHRHLPDIPSGKEMIEEGVDVGELCMSLLKKVEELSLHVMRQDALLGELLEDRL